MKRIRDDSSSLYVHRDTASMFSGYTDKLSKLSVMFAFDNELLSTKIYQRVIRGSLKEVIRQKQADIKFSKKTMEIEKSLRVPGKRNRREIKILLAGECDTKRAVLSDLLETFEVISVEDSLEWRKRLRTLCASRLRRFLDNMLHGDITFESLDFESVDDLYQALTANDAVEPDVDMIKGLKEFLGDSQVQELLQEWSSDPGITELDFQ